VSDPGCASVDDVRQGGPGTEHLRQAGSEHRLVRRRLFAEIRAAIKRSPFSGEGHRKVTARLRREQGIRVGRKRVLRLMREVCLLAPQRALGRRKPLPRDGTIIPGRPT
jgi:hypothetical protein